MNAVKIPRVSCFEKFYLLINLALDIISCALFFDLQESKSGFGFFFFFFIFYGYIVIKTLVNCFNYQCCISNVRELFIQIVRLLALFSAFLAHRHTIYDYYTSIKHMIYCIEYNDYDSYDECYYSNEFDLQSNIDYYEDKIRKRSKQFQKGLLIWIFAEILGLFKCIDLCYRNSEKYKKNPAQFANSQNNVKSNKTYLLLERSQQIQVNIEKVEDTENDQDPDCYNRSSD